ncbi:hypothetical protein GHT06_019922 [Daphnia sinensis]|uniref:Uncharacterized protein n=1 Tax=Daphnia sinensis TaxID=1820382 RepID=A0AAD5KLG0_9CRUS|nr:hypothetical protein GHT06_019922 [Daphnia sinensis]
MKNRLIEILRQNITQCLRLRVPENNSYNEIGARESFIHKIAAIRLFYLEQLGMSFSRKGNTACLPLVTKCWAPYQCWREDEMGNLSGTCLKTKIEVLILCTCSRGLSLRTRMGSGKTTHADHLHSHHILHLWKLL